MPGLKQARGAIALALALLPSAGASAQADSRRTIVVGDLPAGEGDLRLHAFEKFAVRVKYLEELLRKTDPRFRLTAELAPLGAINSSAESRLRSIWTDNRRALALLWGGISRKPNGLRALSSIYAGDFGKDVPFLREDEYFTLVISDFPTDLPRQPDMNLFVTGYVLLLVALNRGKNPCPMLVALDDMYAELGVLYAAPKHRDGIWAHINRIKRGRPSC